MVEQKGEVMVAKMAVQMRVRDVPADLDIGSHLRCEGRIGLALPIKEVWDPAGFIGALNWVCTIQYTLYPKVICNMQAGFQRFQEFFGRQIESKNHILGKYKVWKPLNFSVGEVACDDMFIAKRVHVCSFKICVSARLMTKAFLQLTYPRSTSWLLTHFSCPEHRCGTSPTMPSTIFVLPAIQRQS